MYLSSRTVFFADLNKNDLLESIRSAISLYRQHYGEPRRIWVNAKDMTSDIEEVDGILLERRGGCVRGKVMVM